MSQSNTSAVDYNFNVVRQFTVMTVIWGIVGTLVGVLIAAQLVWPELNFDAAPPFFLSLVRSHSYSGVLKSH